MNARKAAFTALLRVSQGAYSSIALNETLSENDISDQNKALASAIFYGTLERERELDVMLRPFLRQSVSRLEKKVLIILRMGLVQLAFMDKIPESAAVNESVALAKSEGLKKASGLVNAVLRAYIRAGKPGANNAQGEIANGKDEKKSAGSAVPEWLCKLWTDDYGEDIAEKIIDSLHGKPPAYVRINNLVCTAPDEDEFELGGVKLRRVKWLDGAAEVLSRGAVEQSEAYRAGMLHTQDIASQLCCMMTGAQENTDILDACAAPGGKSFTLAELTGGKSRITSCDIHAHRVGLIAKGAQRLHIDCITPLRRDALSDDGEAADLVLCDVPCSGLGVIRRKPDIMNKTTDEISSLPELQYSILESCARKVRPGGVLMYSTCTLCRAENGAVVERFLREHTEFRGESLSLPRDGLRVADEPDCCLTLFPHAAGSDGFFMAKMRRKQAGE